MISKQDLAALQKTVLQCVLTGEALPGSKRAAALPDLEWVLRGPEILLSDADLAGSPALDSPHHNLRIVPEHSLPPETAYLELSHSDAEEDMVTLRLEIALKPPLGARAAGLSAITATFKKKNGEWLLRDEPQVSAN